MTIATRRATVADMPDIVAMLWRFFGRSNVRALVEPDEQSCVTLMQAIIESDGELGVFQVAVDDRSIVGGACFINGAFWFAPRAGWLTELFFYVQPEHRGGTGRMLKDAAESDAKQCGFKGIVLHAGVGEDGSGEAFKKYDYLAGDTMFLKQLVN